jgi:hypothetical protein
MRIIRLPALPAVVLVKGPGIRAVAIPDSLPPHEVLELASLVLSTTEYEEVRHAIKSAPLVPPHHQGRWPGENWTLNRELRHSPVSIMSDNGLTTEQIAADDTMTQQRGHWGTGR